MIVDPIDFLISRDGSVHVRSASGLKAEGPVLGWLVKHKSLKWKAIRPGGFVVGAPSETRDGALSELLAHIYGTSN